MRTLRIITILGASVWFSPAQPRDVTPDVVIHVKSDGPMQLGPLRLAQELATSMFADIGVNVGWSHDPYPMAGCSGHPVRIRLRLIPDAPRDYLPGALAVTFPFATCGQEISVMYDRLVNLKEKSAPRFSRILAHVFAHEISHVLQVVDTHSETGVMKARWDSEDYRKMGWRPLPFLERDRYLIHMGLKWLRNRADPASVGSARQCHNSPVPEIGK